MATANAIWNKSMLMRPCVELDWLTDNEDASVSARRRRMVSCSVTCKRASDRGPDALFCHDQPRPSWACHRERIVTGPGVADVRGIPGGKAPQADTCSPYSSICSPVVIPRPTVRSASCAVMGVVRRHWSVTFPAQYVLKRTRTLKSHRHTSGKCVKIQNVHRKFPDGASERHGMYRLWVFDCRRPCNNIM